MGDTCDMPHGCEPVQELGKVLSQKLEEADIKITKANAGIDWLKFGVTSGLALVVITCGAWGLADKAKHDRIDDKIINVQDKVREDHSECEGTRMLVQEQAKALVALETALPRIEKAQSATDAKLDAFIDEWRKSKRGE